MFHLHCVSNGIDIGNRCLHPVIDDNAALDPKFKACVFCKLRIWRNTDGEHYHIRMERLPLLEKNIYAALLLLEALHSLAQSQPDTVSAHRSVNKGCHIRIKWIHQLLRTLDDRNLHAKVFQVLGKLKPDKSSA